MIMAKIPEEDRHNKWSLGKCDCGGFGERYYNNFHRDYVAKARLSKIVFEDMDLIIRRTTDDHFGLAEFKFSDGGAKDCMNYAQNKTFYDIDQVLKASKLKDRYKGFYYIWSSVADFENSKEIKINGKTVSLNELIDFFHLKQEILDMIPKHNFSSYTLREEKK